MKYSGLWLLHLLPLIAKGFCAPRFSSGRIRQSTADIVTLRQQSNNYDNQEDHHQPSVNKENEEPLSLMFQRAVAWQRSGQYNEALAEYQLIVKAAEQCRVDPSLYAEVHVNLGALYLRQRNAAQARHHLETALQHRHDMGNVHVNLAVLLLQQLVMTSKNMTSSNPTVGVAPAEQQQQQQQKQKQSTLQVLHAAQEHCEQAMRIKDDENGRTHAMASKLLQDIASMKNQI